jgi:hypothetical protein
MATRLSLAIAALISAAAAAQAEPRAMTQDPGGTLNPEELSLGYFAERLTRGEIDPVASSQGYLAAKSGDYDLARRIFENQAASGITQAMTWMGWLEDNGFGGPENPAAAAEWDARAAAAGDHIGMFNSGLNHLRGRGVPQDEAKGRALIDGAARLGDETARQLIADGYDVDTVTPDADEGKYGRRLY